MLSVTRLLFLPQSQVVEMSSSVQGAAVHGSHRERVSASRARRAALNVCRETATSAVGNLLKAEGASRAEFHVHRTALQQKQLC